MAKFKNPENGEVVEILTYSTIFRDGGKIYKDKYGKELKTESGKPFEYIDERDPNAPIEVPYFGKFSNSDGLGRQKILRERSQADFKKNIEEKKHHDQKNAMEQLKNIVTKKD